MELNQAREVYIQKTRIDLDNDDYIILKEPTSFMLREFSDDGKKNIEILQKIFPTCLIEHNFTDNGQPAKNEKVAAFLLDSGMLFTKIVNEWMKDINIDEKKKENLETSQT